MDFQLFNLCSIELNLRIYISRYIMNKSKNKNSLNWMWKNK